MTNELISLVEKNESALANHLLQSTILATMLGLLTLSLGNNRALVRYWVWLAASVKFLLPFSLLFTLGSLLPKQHSAPFNHPVLSYALESVGQPFSGPTFVSEASLQDLPHEPAAYLALALVSVWGCGTLAVMVVWGMRWRQVSASLKRAAPLTSGREIEILQRIESLVLAPRKVVMVGASELTEPVIFGIVRPVVLWPLQLTERLENEHIESILVHELMHVRRHDNLFAAIHMTVEALFWFHPLVWWIGSRMVLERERACDEATVRLIGRPGVYAESLLKASRFCVEAPMVCVSGMASADLKNRVVRIMTGRVEQSLTPLRRLLLGTIACLSLTIPVFFGVVRAASTQDNHGAVDKSQAVAVVSASGRAPADQKEFEVASIRRNISDSRPWLAPPVGRRYTAVNIPLKLLISVAWPPASWPQKLEGAPGWVTTDGYDVTAIMPEGDQSAEAVRLMMQRLLEDRFGLKVHTEPRNAPVYVLLPAKNGLTLPGSTPATCFYGQKPPDADPEAGCGSMNVTPESITNQKISMKWFASVLGGVLGRPVVDKTGFTGSFQVNLEFAPVAPEAESTRPLISSVLEKQLGIKLESQKGSEEVLVIDHVERPSEN